MIAIHEDISKVAPDVWAEVRPKYHGWWQSYHPATGQLCYYSPSSDKFYGLFQCGTLVPRPRMFPMDETGCMLITGDDLYPGIDWDEALGISRPKTLWQRLAAMFKRNE